MRAIVQRVSAASVIVNQEIVSSIGRGICVLVGLSRDDDKEDVEYIIRKMLNLRLFENPESGKRWDKSVKDLGLEILCVSQFTLHVSFKGNKLDFHKSMGPEKAPQFYAEFLENLKRSYEENKVKDGVFGALMKVNLENDGPVTFTIDSKSRE